MEDAIEVVPTWVDKQGRGDAGIPGESIQDKQDAKSAANWAVDKGKEVADDAKQAAKDFNDWTKNKGEELKDSSKDASWWAQSKGEEAKREIRNIAQETGDWADAKAGEIGKELRKAEGQSDITSHEELQSKFGEERRAHTEMAKDAELPATERIKAAGFAIVDGAKEMTEAGLKQFNNFMGESEKDKIAKE